VKNFGNVFYVVAFFGIHKNTLYGNTNGFNGNNYLEYNQYRRIYQSMIIFRNKL